MPIYDSGSIGQSRHFAMELLKEPISLTNLGARVRGGQAARDPHLRPLSTIEGLLLGVVMPICEATHHANVREGVIHRDLKPDNVLLDRSGLRPFVIDFGICSVIDRYIKRYGDVLLIRARLRTRLMSSDRYFALFTILTVTPPARNSMYSCKPIRWLPVSVNTIVK